MKSKLHKITGRNRFCGASAMSAVLGIPSHDCAAYVRKATGRINIMGMYNSELKQALELIGVKFQVIETGNITFAEYSRTHGFDAPCIVNVTGHYIAVHADQWCDSQNKKPQNISAYQQRKRVKRVFLIEEIPSSFPAIKEQRPKFTGDKTSLVDLINHYGNKTLIEAFKCRLEDFEEEPDIQFSYQEAIKAAFSDLHDLYHMGYEPETGWKTINLLAHKNGAL